MRQDFQPQAEGAQQKPRVWWSTMSSEVAPAPQAPADTIVKYKVKKGQTLADVSMERQVKLKDDQEAKALFGRHDQNLRLIERELDVKITARSGNVVMLGTDQDTKKAATL